MVDHALVLACATARPLLSVEGPIKNVVHSPRLGAVESTAFDSWQELLKGGDVGGVHLHIAARKERVQFSAALIASAVLCYSVDEFIDSRRLRQFRDLVAEPLGFLF